MKQHDAGLRRTLEVVRTLTDALPADHYVGRAVILDAVMNKRTGCEHSENGGYLASQNSRMGEFEGEIDDYLDQLVKEGSLRRVIAWKSTTCQFEMGKERIYANALYRASER